MTHGPFSVDHSDYDHIYAMNELEKKINEIRGRASDLDKIVFTDTVPALKVVLFCRREEVIKIKLEVDSYKILWKNKKSALVKVFFKSFSEEPFWMDDGGSISAKETILKCRLLEKHKASEVVFVTKKSLMKFKKGY
ncbi:TPA: hypothetical protein HA241_04045 [Candidatus Woesearchaeota archaeon]|nr:hypothetical protein [Candidatus Woesearchaeota archaeon]